MKLVLGFVYDVAASSSRWKENISVGARNSRLAGSVRLGVGLVRPAEEEKQEQNKRQLKIYLYKIKDTRFWTRITGMVARAVVGLQIVYG